MKPFKLAGRELRQTPSTIDISGISVGGEELAIIAGPCAIESEDSFIETALKVREAGASILRGGAYKPRSSPYSFQGLQEDGLKIMAKAREITGMKIVTEVVDTRDVELVASYADIIQIGARNMQNSGCCMSRPHIKTHIAETRACRHDRGMADGSGIYNGRETKTSSCAKEAYAHMKHLQGTPSISVPYLW